MRNIERMECVYYAGPVPRNKAVLTILSLLFDKIHFPGVYLPKGDYDIDGVAAEIVRLEQLNDPYYDTQLLIGVLKFLSFRLPLDGICEFALKEDSAWEGRRECDTQEDELMHAIAASMHPPKPGWEPILEKDVLKGHPGGKETVEYPATFQYWAKANIHSKRYNLPLINDSPSLPFPTPESYKNDAQGLATVLAIECMKVIIADLPLLTPQQITDFRIENNKLLHGFRKSMLRYANDLNGRLESGDEGDVREHAAFLIQSEIEPALHDIKALLDKSTRNWFKRTGDFMKFSANLGWAWLANDPSKLGNAALSVADFLTSELNAKGDRKDAVKQSGLYYALKVRQLGQ